MLGYVTGPMSVSMFLNTLFPESHIPCLTHHQSDTMQFRSGPFKKMLQSCTEMEAYTPFVLQFFSFSQTSFFAYSLVVLMPFLV